MENEKVIMCILEKLKEPDLQENMIYDLHSVLQEVLEASGCPFGIMIRRLPLDVRTVLERIGIVALWFCGSEQTLLYWEESEVKRYNENRRRDVFDIFWAVHPKAWDTNDVPKAYRLIGTIGEFKVIAE